MLLVVVVVGGGDNVLLLPHVLTGITHDLFFKFICDHSFYMGIFPIIRWFVAFLHTYFKVQLWCTFYWSTLNKLYYNESNFVIEFFICTFVLLNWVKSVKLTWGITISIEVYNCKNPVHLFKHNSITLYFFFIMDHLLETLSLQW